MAQTPIFKYTTPEDLTPNDVAAHMGALALAIEIEQVRQGPLENRPAAGTQGRLYFATTWKDSYNGNSTKPWNVLYRDDGQNWQQLNDSVVQTYTPTWSVEPGATFNIAVHGGTAAAAEYQVKAGGKCWLNINQQLTISGSTSIHAIRAGLAINASSWVSAPGIGDGNGYIAEVQVNADLDVVQFHCGNGTTGNIWTAGVDYWFRTTAEYRVG